MDHESVYYKYHNIVLMLEMGFAFLFPCTTQMLGILSYGVLLSYMWYTKQLLFYPYPFSSLDGMLIYSDPPSTPLWIDFSFDIGSLLVVGLPIEPLPVSETYFFSIDILSVVAMN
jgi:hypothetical protein